MGYRKFREIEEKAKASVKVVTDAKDAAGRHLQEIQNIREKADAEFSHLDANFTAENPMVATRTIANIRDNPDASLVEMGNCRCHVIATARQARGCNREMARNCRNYGKN